MAVTIGRNKNAERVVGQLNDVTRSVRTSFERLSSGLRINRAADDAAGLAVSEHLNYKSRVYGRAILNVNDGISALQIADGTLGAATNVLQRMGELAAQAANGAFSVTQRRALDVEFNQLDRELRRIGQTTSFNGTSVLGGQARRSVSASYISGSPGTVGNMVVSQDGRYVTYHNSGAGTVEQRDTTTGAVQVLASGVTTLTNLSSDATGNTVIFASGDNLTGQNTVGAAQVFKWERSTGTLSQATSSVAGTFILSATLSADGSTIAVNTNMDYLDGGNVADGGSAGLWGIYVLNASTGAVRAVHENSAVFHGNLALSANGQYLAYTSQINISGGNADNNAEVYMANLSGSSAVIRQVTSTTGVENPTLFTSNSGDVYWASGYNLTGQNSGLRQQIFRYSYGSNQTTQLTNNTVDNGATVFYGMSMSSDGSTLNFIASSEQFDTTTTPSFELFRFNTETLVAEQLTAASIAGLLNPYAYMLSGDGNTIVGSSASGIFRFDVGREDASYNIEAGHGAFGSIATSVSALNGTIRGLGSLTLSSRGGAIGALDTITDNLARLAKSRGAIGASMARLESASRVLTGLNTQYIAARSRIRDVDIAAESANLLRNTIRQEAATALLGQANQDPRIALQLLGVG